MDKPKRAYYLFVAADIVTPSGERINSRTVIAGRLMKQYWPINARTRYRKNLKPGDRAVFYAARTGGSNFVATAEVASEAIELRLRERAVVEYEHDYLLAAPYGVRLINASFFSRPLFAKRFLSELSFVEDPTNWGAYFRGGIVKLSESDYNMLTEYRPTASSCSAPHNSPPSCGEEK